MVAAYEPDESSYEHDVTAEHLDILATATGAQGRKLKVFELENPYDIREEFLHDDFAAGYIGYYVCNGAVISQSFGDKSADQAAKKVLQNAFPDRAIEQLNTDALAAGGGSIHCATQQEPMV